MTTVEAIGLFNSKSPHELTAGQVAGIREVLQCNPAILAVLGGDDKVEAYLAAADEALLTELRESLRPGDVVLVKGSNRIFWQVNFVDRLLAALES